MVTQPAATTTVILDAERRVAVNAPCVKCGYNLRTLLADAVCTECGHPVAESIWGFYLRFSPPKWVRGLGRGLLVVLISIGAGVVIVPLLTMLISLPFMLASSGGNPPPTGTMRAALVVQFALSMAATIAAMVGLYWLTRRDPAVTQREGLTARRVLRYCLFLLPIPPLGDLLIGWAIPTQFLATQPANLPGAEALTSFAVLAAATTVFDFVAYVVAPLALLRHLGALLRRIPRPGLARFARLEFWGLLAGAAVLAAGLFLMAARVLPAVTGMQQIISSVPTTGPVPPPSSAPTSAPVSAPRMTVGPSGTITTIGPSGTITVTSVHMTATAPTTSPASMPATFPAGGFAPPPGFMTGVIIGSVVLGVGGCGMLALGVAGIVLLIMACRAFYAAAREAEVNQAGAAA